MKSLLLRAVLTSAVIGGLMSSAVAGVRKDWDWVGKKRTLKVWVNVPADKKLGDVKVSDAVTAALAEINGSGSDWKLENGTEADHDIEIKLADIDEDVGGAMNEFTKINKKREVSKRTITIDPTPKGGETWGSSGKKFDPTTVITHELLHKLRIKHQAGKTTGDSGNIADPSVPGDHQKELSDDDKTDLKESDNIGAGSTQKDVKNAGPGNPGVKNFQFGSTSVSFPDQTFALDVEIGFSLTSDFETLIAPFAFDTGFDDFRMVRGVLLDITGGTTNDASGGVNFELEYEDLGFDIADPEYLPIIESTLRPFIYDTTSGIWEEASTEFFLDEVQNRLWFDLDVDALLDSDNFGFDPDNPSTAFSFVALGGYEIPEPGTLVMLLAAGLAGLLLSAFRRRRAT